MAMTTPTRSRRLRRTLALTAVAASAGLVFTACAGEPSPVTKAVAQAAAPSPTPTSSVVSSIQPAAGSVSGGTITLSASSVLRPGANPPSAVRLSVADTGEGMTPDQVSRIFERFTRGEGIRLDDQSGFGLGLAIVNELVQLHGGSVSVTSAPGQGSSFTVTLPFLRVAD